MRPMRRARPVLVLALLIPAAAEARTYRIADLSERAVAEVKRDTRVPVLLPDRLSLDYSRRLHISATTFRGGYDITLGAVRDCGANVCSLGSVAATPGGRLGFRQRVRLRGGRRGSFKGLTCRASCSPPTIDFRRGRVLYSIQAKLSTASDRIARRRLVRAANEALRAGPR